MPVLVIRMKEEDSERQAAETPKHGTRTFLIALIMPRVAYVINMSVFAVALPAIRHDFGVPNDVLSWFRTIYSLALIIFMPIYGSLGDRVGKRKVFLWAIAVFIFGTVTILVAPSFALNLIGRALQGAGSAGIMTLGLGIISEIYPTADLGKNLGRWNFAAPLTGVVTILLAGVLVDALGWRTVLILPIAFGLLALFNARKRVSVAVPPVAESNSGLGILKNIDWVGVALLSAAMTSLVFYIYSRMITGTASLRDWRLLAVTITLFVVLYFWERRNAAPFLDLKMFTNRLFTVASLSALIRMFSVSGFGLLVPLYLTDIWELRASLIGFIIVVRAATMLATVRLGGQLADRWGSRLPVTIGFLVQTVSVIYMALFGNREPWSLVFIGLALNGLGSGLSISALDRAAMVQISKKRVGIAAGMYSMIRMVGAVLGASLAGVLLQQGLDSGLAVLAAYRVVFWAISGIGLLGVASGLTMRK